MWWSPDSKKIAYYRFDESKVPDYYLHTRPDQAAEHDGRRSLSRRPGVRIRSSTCSSTMWTARKRSTVDVRDGKPFDERVVGHYVYHVRWSPDGKELLVQSHQSPAEHHGVRRLQSRDRQVPRDRARGMAAKLGRRTRPQLQYLKDGKPLHLGVGANRLAELLSLRPERQGCMATLTDHAFEVASIVRVDEDAGLLYYMARDGDNPMKLQLHRVGLDGKGDMRLTDPAFHHTVDIAPDGKHFIDIVPDARSAAQ